MKIIKKIYTINFKDNKYPLEVFVLSGLKPKIREKVKVKRK